MAAAVGRGGWRPRREGPLVALAAGGGVLAGFGAILLVTYSTGPALSFLALGSGLVLGAVFLRATARGVPA